MTKPEAQISDARLREIVGEFGSSFMIHDIASELLRLRKACRAVLRYAEDWAAKEGTPGWEIAVITRKALTPTGRSKGRRS